MNAIVEAGAQVLGRGGWPAFNTNRVAEVAGVSIGTVYQYFPDKIALVQALRERHFTEVLGAVAGAGEASRPLDERIDELVESLAHVHRGAPALHRALLEDAPPTVQLRRDVDRFEREYFAAFERLLASRSGARRRNFDPKAGARVLAAAVEGAIHDAAQRGTIGSRALRDELKELVRAYVAGSYRS